MNEYNSQYEKEDDDNYNCSTKHITSSDGIPQPYGQRPIETSWHNAQKCPIQDLPPATIHSTAPHNNVLEQLFNP